jgi:hypothetical protein
MNGTEKHQSPTLFLVAIAILISSLLPCLAESDDLAAGGGTNSPSLAQSANWQVGELLYSDNFTARKESGRSIHADSNYTKYYKDGKYHIGLLKSGWTSRENIEGTDFRDFVLEVEASQDGGPDDNGYGVITRFADIGNYSLFMISGDGFFAYFKKEDNAVVVPVKWTKSDAIKTGNATNILKVVALGDKYTFYVNGIEVANYTDSKPVSGSIGLYLESEVDGGAYASFDNLRVWAMKE